MDNDNSGWLVNTCILPLGGEGGGLYTHELL